MTANVTELIAAGFDTLEYHMLDANGIAAGPSGSITAGATGSAAGRMRGVKTSDINIPEPDITNITGDDSAQGNFIWSPTTLPGFNIDVAVADLQDEGYFQGTTAENSGDLTFGVWQPKDQDFPDFCLIGVSRAKSKMSGSDGVSGYSGIIIPKCNIVPLGRVSFTEREGAVFRYRVAVNMSDGYPWGQTLKTATQGTTGGAVFPWTAENRITIHAWTGNSVVSSFNTQETPASSSVNKMRVFVDKVINSGGVTVTTATKTVALVPTPGAVRVVAVYEYTR
jgi:hypothetical protein